MKEDSEVAMMVGATGEAVDSRRTMMHSNSGVTCMAKGPTPPKNATP